jgi:hypothetical protein
MVPTNQKLFIQVEKRMLWNNLIKVQCINNIFYIGNIIKGMKNHCRFNNKTKEMNEYTRPVL